MAAAVERHAVVAAGARGVELRADGGRVRVPVGGRLPEPRRGRRHADGAPPGLLGVRRDLAEVLALKIDYSGLYGTGTNSEPLGLKNTTTGDTLCDPDDSIVLETLFIPEPVISVAVEPKTKGDMEKLSKALTSLSEEDPTFRVSTDEETGQTVIAGMGELHLEILVDRMLREFKVEANIGAPQVSYRETIRGSAGGEGKFSRQTGGKGQYGHVVIEMEPGEPGSGFEFVNKIVGGVVPKEYIKPAEQGMKETCESGVIAGFPLIDVKCTMVDGSYHDVDSSQVAFEQAGMLGFREVARKAGLELLEPFMKVVVTTPEEFVGNVSGDLNRRRALISESEQRGNARLLTAEAPLSEMFGYASTLRGMTQGRASFSMEPLEYRIVPSNIAKTILEEGEKSK